METKIKIAIQKSGRLYEDSVALLKECGIRFSAYGSRLKAEARNFPAEILFLRVSDIPAYVEDGVVDIGIIGENVHIEKNKSINVIDYLGFSKCRVSLAVKRELEYTDLTYFEGKRVATSYPHTLKTFFEEKNINVDVHLISGSVEIAPSIGLADAVCDIVSTGSTLLSNGLKEVETILRSQAVLVANQNMSTEKQALLDKLMFRIKAYKKAKNTKYILLNAPNDKLDEIVDIIPGMKSPTILPLAEEGWSSVHSVIDEDDFWNIIDQLQEKGAGGILIVPIEKMIV